MLTYLGLGLGWSMNKFEYNYYLRYDVIEWFLHFCKIMSIEGERQKKKRKLSIVKLPCCCFFFLIERWTKRWGKIWQQYFQNLRVHRTSVPSTLYVPVCVLLRYVSYRIFTVGILECTLNVYCTFLHDFWIQTIK